MVHTKHISAVYHKISPPKRRDHFIISGDDPAGCRAMSHGRTYLNNHGHLRRAARHATGNLICIILFFISAVKVPAQFLPSCPTRGQMRLALRESNLQFVYNFSALFA